MSGNRLLGAVPYPNVLGAHPQHLRERRPRIGPVPDQRPGPARLARDVAAFNLPVRVGQLLEVGL